MQKQVKQTKMLGASVNKRLYINKMDKKMQKKSNNPNSIKITLLKQPIHTKSFYASPQIKEELRSKMSPSYPSKNHNTNTSIAYLSSIIQDDKLQEQDKFSSFNQVIDQECGTPNNNQYSSNFEQQNQLVKFLKPREKGRELSCFVQNSKIYRSKTEEIDKMIEQRKLMPINRLKVGTKNIKFSPKNKQQLTQDFNEFVLNKELSIETQIQYLKRDNTLCQKRIIEQRRPRKSTFQLISAQNEINKTSIPSHQKAEINMKNMNPKKVRAEEESKYASYLKRLKSSIPQIDHFGWSKLNKTLFKLKSQ